MDEAKAALVNDDYAASLAPHEVAALALTDALIGVPGPLTDELKKALEAHFSAAEIVELTLGVGLFLGMSKVLITLGLEPQDMPVTVIPTPGSDATVA
jgi:alkylhydroperoxidase family enzyme